MRAIVICLMSFYLVTTNFIYGNSDSLEFEQVDRFRIHADFMLSLSSYKLMGVSDISSSSLTIINNKEVTTQPNYKYVEKRVFGFNPLLHVGLNIPIYRKRNWSTGFKINGGVGYQYGIVAQDFSSVIFDFPQYVYFRNYKNDFDYTILVGYKQTLAPISTGLFLVGFDFNLSDRTALRFYVSPFRTTYYSKLTNGDLKPAIRAIEFGAGIVF